MIGARCVRDLEMRAQERGAQFGDQFLEGIGLVTEALAEVPLEAMLGTAAMQIMPISA